MTTFSLTYDGALKSLVLVAGREIVDDVSELHIAKKNGVYECSVVRANGDRPVRLVATTSEEGKAAVERADGCLKESIPGFVEVPEGSGDLRLQVEIAKYMSS